MTGAEDKKRLSSVNQEMDTSTFVSGTRDRPPVYGVDTIDSSRAGQGRRYRADARRPALVADMEVAKEHAQ